MDPSGLEGIPVDLITFVIFVASIFLGLFGGKKSRTITVPILPSPMQFLQPTQLPANFSAATAPAALSLTPPFTEDQIAAMDQPIEEYSVLEMADALALLTGLGLAPRAAWTATRAMGPAVLGGLRSLGETGAIRIG